MSELERYEQAMPGVEWRTPITINVLGKGRFMLCRVCIAKEGLRAVDAAERSFDSADEFLEHLRDHEKAA